MKKKIQLIMLLLLVAMLTGCKERTSTGDCCTCLDCPECDVCCSCDHPYLNK